MEYGKLLNVFPQHQSTWDYFLTLGGQANAASILGFLLGVVTTAASIVGWARTKLSKAARDLDELTADRDRKDAKIAVLISQLKKTQEVLKATNPKDVITAAREHLKAERYWQAQDALKGWMSVQGPSVGEILIARCLFERAHASGKHRLARLLIARSFVVGAVACNPADKSALLILSEVEAAISVQGDTLTIDQAFLNASTVSDVLFDEAFEARAEAAIQECETSVAQGLFHTAGALVEFAVASFTVLYGAKSARSLAAEALLAYTLVLRSRVDEALSLARRVVRDEEVHPALGKDHVETLSGRYYLAGCLYCSGRLEEALGLAESVMKGQSANTALGPQSPLTLRTELLIARILVAMAEYAAARDRLLVLKHKLEGDPVFGETHPFCQTCYEYLIYAGMSLEDTKVIREAYEKLIKPDSDSDSPVPLTPEQLQVKKAVAHTFRFDDPERALSMLEEVAADQTQHPSLGPRASDTLNTRRHIYLVLSKLGRFDEALDAIRDRQREEADSVGDVGNMARLFEDEARVLYDAQRFDEAEPVSRKAIAAQSEHPGLGPKNTITLQSRIVHAAIQYARRCYAAAHREAEAILADVRSNQLSRENAILEDATALIQACENKEAISKDF